MLVGLTFQELESLMLLTVIVPEMFILTELKVITITVLFGV